MGNDKDAAIQCTFEKICEIIKSNPGNATNSGDKGLLVSASELYPFIAWIISTILNTSQNTSFNHVHCIAD